MEIHPLLLFCIFSEKNDINGVWQWWLCTARRTFKMFAKNYTKTFPYCPESMKPYSETSTELRKIIQSTFWVGTLVGTLPLGNVCIILDNNLQTCHLKYVSDFKLRMVTRARRPWFFRWRHVWGPKSLFFPDGKKVCIIRFCHKDSDYPKTSQTIRTLSRLSGNFPTYQKTFQIV